MTGIELCGDVPFKFVFTIVTMLNFDGDSWRYVKQTLNLKWNTCP